MRHAWTLYWRWVAAGLRAQLQYRASFVMRTLGQFGITAIEFFSMWALFHRFHRLGSWTLPEVAIFYGVVGIAWALTDTFGRGLDNFGALVKSGEFDRMLLRPRSLALQLLAQDPQLRRLGRMTQAALVLGWGWWTLGLAVTPERVALFAGAVLGGGALFLGLLVVQATISFWTVESLEIMNVLTYGGVTMAQYPLSIYPDWLRRCFLFGVPLGFVTYFPVVTLLGKSDPLGGAAWWGWLGPLAGFAFLFVSRQVWRLGVRHYASTGS